MNSPIDPASQRGSPREVFGAFFKLGLGSFGGPIAHIGYLHREFVAKRAWVDESRYAQLLALSQFLPGPSSSQLGFSLGLIRAGWMGGIAAFVAFALPSALLMFAFAHAMVWLERPSGQAATHGLKLLAVAVVAHGVVTMAVRLTPDVRRRLIAIGAAAVLIVSGTAAMQLVVVAGGAFLGWALCRDVEQLGEAAFQMRYGVRTGGALLIGFSVLLIAAIAIDPAGNSSISAVQAFYRAGALVFGGAHVVLPLLEQSFVTPGWISADEFLAGYGAAQALPGPMFSLAAFIGARLDIGPGGTTGALLSVIAIYLPGLMLIAGMLPLWRWLSSHDSAVNALAGVNAAVVGLLAAALYDPVWTSAVLTPLDFFIALVGFLLLTTGRVSVLVVLGWCVLAAVGKQLVPSGLG